MNHARVARSVLVLLMLLAAAAPRATAAAAAPPLSVPEYVARLDVLTALVAAPHDPSGRPSAGEIPQVWRVDGSLRVFDIPTGLVRRDLRAWQARRDEAARERLLNHLHLLRSEAASFERPAADRVAERALLTGILKADEFRNVHGPTWLDRLRQRVLELVARLLGRLFERSAIPAIGNVLVYVLIALAVVVLAVWTFRFLRQTAAADTVLPERIIAPTREWPLWLADAQAAAARGSWRDAIHLTYWCAVSFLEAKGAWRPDRTRTPREYLRLLPASSDDRTLLAALTRRFELVWYGTEPADAQAFADSIANLKNLGCPTG